MTKPGEGMMRNLKMPQFYRAEYFTIILITLFVLAFAVSGWLVGGADTWRYMTSLSLSVVLCLLVLSLINYVLRVVRWQLFSNTLGLAVPLRLNALYYVAGFSMTMTPGKMGEALRLWFLRRGHGYSYEKTAGLLIADRLYDLNASALLMLTSAFVLTAYVPIALISIGLAVAITVVLSRPGILYGLINSLTSANSPRRLKFALLRGKRAMFIASKMGSWPLLANATAISVVGWLAEGIGFWLLLQAIGTDIGMTKAIFIFLFSTVVGVLTFLPGGLVGVEASMIGLLVSQGVAADAAIAATAVTRVVTLWFAVLLGFAVLPFAIKLISRPAKSPSS